MIIVLTLGRDQSLEPVSNALDLAN
jgi:hypothetical protein